jgi:tRNA A-37 threonylcarbamoyl transferase component Bud32
MSEQTTNKSADYVLLTRLADEFAGPIACGERPSLQEYIDRHPELADEMRELFPAMVEIEQVKQDHHEGAEQAAAPPSYSLRQVGDFRIIREVGKGGMGIVYEAEQMSLGRHVALKVLPKNMLLDGKAKRRFEREARFAARLHHTNIVPVFGVGEQDGMPYFVMQFIQGLGLDEVLEELKRLRPADVRTGTFAGGDLRVSRRAEQGSHVAGEKADQNAVTKSAGTAVNVARSLMTGEFHSPTDHPDEAIAPVTVNAPHEDVSMGDGTRSRASSQSLPRSSSSVVLPGRIRDRTKSSNKKRTYWQSVASVGAQVGEALEYAHKQGICHRDIKPSN